MAIAVATVFIVPCVSGSSGRHDVSWWHAMDGIPILMEKRLDRRMSVNNYSSAVHPIRGGWSSLAWKIPGIRGLCRSNLFLSGHDHLS